jgi:hypothetical protein
MRLSQLTLSLSIALMFGCTSKEEYCDTGDDTLVEPCDYGYGRAADGECYLLACYATDDGCGDEASSDCGLSTEPCADGFGRGLDDNCYRLSGA